MSNKTAGRRRQHSHDRQARDVHRPRSDSQDAAQDAELTRELEDSFPASDPPQMTQPDVKPGGPDRAEHHRKSPV